MRCIALLCSLVALTSLPIAAQANNTGGSGWSVNVYSVSSGTWSGFYDVFVPVSGHPGEWEDNTASTQWISAWSNFSTTPGAGDYVHTTDANARYYYLFHYDFGAPISGGSVSFAAGWDNILKGFQFSNGSFLSLPSTYQVGAATDRSVDDHFGFCRTGDAMHDSGEAICTTVFSMDVEAGATWMEVLVWGDGLTDGLWLQWDESSITAESTVPEPATMTLLATGLAGLAGSSLRRRRKPAAE